MSDLTLTSVWLQNFRLHTDFQLDLTQPLTCISGHNAAGKTSLVEAIGILGTGKSFRAQKIEEMVRFGSELARIKTVLPENLGKKSIQVTLTTGVVQGARAPKSKFLLDGVSKRKKDVVGQFYPVVFRPEDMRLVEGSPGRRRNFLDTILATLHSDYGYHLTQYEQVLRRRNKVLLAIREKEQPRSALQFWSEKLLEHGQVLQAHRTEFVEFANTIGSALNFQLAYLPKIISAERLAEYEQRAIAAGHTLTGPHKDDFEVRLAFTSNQQVRQSLATYGSRGQQRLGVLWLKSCELAYAGSQQAPTILLLDDIYSELDAQSRAVVDKLLSAQQTVVTTADPQVAEQLVAAAQVQL